MKDEQTPAEFAVDAFDALDEAEMIVFHNGQPTTWRWIFAGPGHPKGIAQTTRLSREELQTKKLRTMALANGLPYIPPDESVDQVRAKNVEFVLERLIGWTPVKINGEMVPFSEENARAMLMDPRKGNLFSQAYNFLSSERSFMRRSVTG